MALTCEISAKDLCMRKSRRQSHYRDDGDPLDCLHARADPRLFDRVSF